MRGLKPLPPSSLQWTPVGPTMTSVVSPPAVTSTVKTIGDEMWTTWLGIALMYPRHELPLVLAAIIPPEVPESVANICPGLSVAIPNLAFIGGGVGGGAW